MQTTLKHLPKHNLLTPTILIAKQYYNFTPNLTVSIHIIFHHIHHSMPNIHHIKHPTLFSHFTHNLSIFLSTRGWPTRNTNFHVPDYLLRSRCRPPPLFLSVFFRNWIISRIFFIGLTFRIPI